MTQLTQTAILARKVVRYTIFGLLFLIIGRVVLNMGIEIYKRLFPAPPPPPTVAFGRLPSLPFPERVVPEKITYRLETPEGELPSFPTQAKVYFMPRLTAGLLSLDLAKDKAYALGFIPNEEEVTPTVYRFRHRTAPTILEMNIITGAFSISYDLSSETSPISGRPPAPEVAASNIRSYLSSAGLFPEDLTGQTNHEFLKVQDGKISSALSLSEADLVRIGFFRKPYDELPSLTPSPGQANVWFIVSGSRERDRQVVAAEFHYYPVDESQMATYPIKTSQAAWNELSAGEAFVANLGAIKEGETVTIRRVYLAYYDSSQESEFYQPVVVFEGDGGFVAYVPAVTSEYYGD